MIDFFARLFDSSGFPPRWRCGTWTPAQGWLHITADFLIFSAYFAIPVALWYFARRRADWPFRHLLWLFGAFILACGSTHLMEAVIFWWPAYRLAGALKAVTAVISCATVVVLIPAIPKALAMRTPEELEREVAARRAAEAELTKANAELEEREEQLTLANAVLHVERERFRTTLESIGDGVIATDTDGRVTFLNAAAESQTGWPSADAAGQPIQTVFHIVNETTRARVENPALQALRDGTVVGLANHTVLVGRDSSERPIDDCAAPIRDGAGGVSGAVLVFRDVSDRKRSEEGLRRSEERYRLLFDANPHPMWVFDRGTLAFLAVNDAAVAKYGYTRAEFLAQTIKDIRPPEDVPALLADVATPADGLDDAGVWRHRLKDGRVIRVRIASHSLAFDGRPAEVVLAQDVTDQLRAEEELRASEERQRSLVAALAEGVLYQSADSTIQTCNGSAERILGLSADELCGRTSYDPRWRAVREDGSPFPGEEHPSMVTLRTGRPCEGVVMGVHRPDGTLAWIVINAEPLARTGEVAPYGVVCSFSDITDRKKAADALDASNRLYRLLADHGHDVVMLLAADGRELYVSPSCERLSGYTPEEVLRAGPWHLVHPDDRPAAQRAWAAAAAGEAATAEWRCVHRDGRHLWMETVVTPVGGDDGSVAQVVASSRDVTGRRAVEDQLRQAQKLKAIGQLAGGVAHDFNNLLTVVNGCGELVLAELPADAPARPLVEAIVAAGERGAGLTHQLLAFSRQQMLKTEVFDLNGVVPATAKLVGRLLGEDIVLSLRLDPAAGSIKADLGQVEQIIINLAVNARDAMPTGGTLVIETAPAEVPDADPRPSPDARPGRYVRLAVADTGTGMAPEVQARLFEPFFTTKPAGKGTGLGLATVYGIVRQSGGFLTVQSEAGRGSTFAVFLPRHDSAPDPLKSAARPKARAGGSETVLVVEDDGSVRRLTTGILLKQGYRVESAEDGATALAVCERLPAPPDLLLTDVVMPGMSGRELAEALTARYPRLRVAFLSGYTADDVLRHGVEEERVAFLQKPYTPDGLARLVRQVLDGSVDE